MAAGGGIGAEEDGDGTGAAALRLGGANLGAPWSLEFTLAFAAPLPPAGRGSSCHILLGDEMEAFYMVALKLNDGSGGADHAQLYIADDQGHCIFHNVPLFFGMRHRVSLNWDGTMHRALLDGAEAVSGMLRNPATILAPDASLAIAGDESTSRWTIFEFQFYVTET